MTLLVSPRTIALIVLAGFLVFELVFGHVYVRTNDVHAWKGHEVVSLPSCELHYFEEKPRSFGLVRPRKPVRIWIWNELKRFW